MASVNSVTKGKMQAKKASTRTASLTMKKANSQVMAPIKGFGGGKG